MRFCLATVQIQYRHVKDDKSPEGKTLFQKRSLRYAITFLNKSTDSGVTDLPF